MDGVIPDAVWEGLSDRSNKIRRKAAKEIREIVNQMDNDDENALSFLINHLTTGFVCSQESNKRKGGVVGLAGISAGLSIQRPWHLVQKIVPPVLDSLSDPDRRVRYHACKALYKISKVWKEALITSFGKMLNALCKLSADSDADVQGAANRLDNLLKEIVTETAEFRIEDFIPLLTMRMHVLDTLERKFLVGWITALDGAPNINILGVLPRFLDGLFDMLSDANNELQQQATLALSNFLPQIENDYIVDLGCVTKIVIKRTSSPDELTRQTSIDWLTQLLRHHSQQLVPFYDDILEAILTLTSDDVENISQAASGTSQEFRTLHANSTVDNMRVMMSTARRYLNDESDSTKAEALHWIRVLLAPVLPEIIRNWDEISELLLQASNPSHEVAADQGGHPGADRVEGLSFYKTIGSDTYKLQIPKQLIKNSDYPLGGSHQTITIQDEDDRRFNVKYDGYWKRLSTHWNDVADANHLLTGDLLVSNKCLFLEKHWKYESRLRCWVAFQALHHWQGTRCTRLSIFEEFQALHYDALHTIILQL